MISLFVMRAHPFTFTVKLSPSDVPLLLSTHQNGAEMWRLLISKKKKKKKEIRIHRVGVIKMNQTYRPSLDSSETLYEWNFCVSLHYAVFKWPLSICSCASRSSRSHFQRRLRESCSACLLIMQHPELNTALPFFFFRGKSSNVFSGAIQTHVSVISFSPCHNRFPVPPSPLLPVQRLQVLHSVSEVSAIIAVTWHAQDNTRFRRKEN